MRKATPERPVVAGNWAETFFGAQFVEIFTKLGKFENTAADVESIVALMALPKSALILDIPCGFGRFSGPLSQKGYTVVGADSSHHLLRNAIERNPGPEYVYADMREPPNRNFAAVLNLWTSFGYFETTAEDIVALQSWYNVLAPGGQIVIEISDLERAIAQNKQSDDDITYKHRIENDVVEEAWIDWQRQQAVIAYSIGDSCLMGVTRIYSREQLSDMLMQVGFRNLQFYGGFDCRPKGPHDRLVIHAIKPLNASVESKSVLQNRK